MVHIHTPLASAGEVASSASNNPELSAFLLGLEPTLKSNSTLLAQGDRALAQDLYQEGAVAAVAAVFRYHSGIGTVEGFAAWCAINRMRDFKRSHVARASRFAAPLDDGAPEVCDEEAVTDLVNRIDAGSLRPLLQRVLTGRQRAVVEALYFMALSAGEAGKLLGISPQRVNQLHVAAVRHLRSALGVSTDANAN